MKIFFFSRSFCRRRRKIARNQNPSFNLPARRDKQNLPGLGTCFATHNATFALNWKACWTRTHQLRELIASLSVDHILSRWFLSIIVFHEMLIHVSWCHSVYIYSMTTLVLTSFGQKCLGIFSNLKRKQDLKTKINSFNGKKKKIIVKGNFVALKANT